jgi:hypothetical protein
MYDYAILNIGIGANADGLHTAVLVDFVGADNGIWPDEYVLANHHLAADDGGPVDVCGLCNLR